MGEFEDNGFETSETVETVENAETIETTDTYDTYADQSSDTVYESTPVYEETYAEPDKQSKAFAIVALVCGILSLLCSCCGWFGIILSIAAIVFGILSINKEEDAKGMAIAGIVCGAIGLLIAIVVVIMGAALSSLDSDSVEQFVEQFEETL